LASYAFNSGLDQSKIILIHRGIDIPEKGDYRNLPVHDVSRHARRTLEKVKIYFDPSHTCGPKLREQIVEETILAMLMKEGNRWLYDGALIEAGNSSTDTNQHLTIGEVQYLAQELAKYRNLNCPEKYEK